MNKKGSFVITIAIILTLIWISFYLLKIININLLSIIDQEYILKTNTSKDNDSNIKNNNNIENQNENKNEIKKVVEIDQAKEKINSLRKKLELKWLIIKWNIHLQNKEYTIALTKYLQVHKNIPNDESIIKKIWDSYFNLKMFHQAYKYYKKIKNYKYIDKKNLINSFLYSTTLTKDNINKIVMELRHLKLNEEDMFYYTNSFLCSENFNLCKENFQNYLKNDNKLNNKNIISNDLKNINLALENYKNFNLEDTSYEDALITGAFFENWLYTIAIDSSLKILKEKPDYKPIIKIIAKSYFEIWDYIEAKNYLMKYHNFWEENAEISFFLWIVYEKMHEYILSSIHLKKAISLWYKLSLNAKKRLIYNYHELWEIEKMLSIFKNIIKENTITNEELSLAIFYNILNNKIEDALSFTKLALKKHPNDEIFYAYMWWIKLQENKIESINEAEKHIKKWFHINNKNPMINLIAWKLEEKKWNNELANTYYKRTITLDKNWEFWKIAEQDLDNLNKKLWISKKIN